MTNKEAIELLTSLTQFEGDENFIRTAPMVSDKDTVEALKMGIEALSELRSSRREIRKIAEENYNWGFERGKEEGRTKGEWFVNPHSMVMKCIVCGHEETTKEVGVVNEDKHFCYWCGADMRGGAR